MRILIVEDDKHIAHNLKQGFLDEHYATDVAFNGEEGLFQAQSVDYDCIVLDLMLPMIDGLEVCRKLRAERNNTPILMLTAKDTLEDKVNGLDMGADDYLTKPFSFEELLARVRSIIRRSTKTDSIIKVDSLELNPISHVVTRSGKEISLTGKEYALLEYFMHHPHQVLSKDQILNHVWDYSYDSLSNIIEVLIRRLRLKIDMAYPKEKKLFQTVRGLGYRLG